MCWHKWGKWEQYEVAMKYCRFDSLDKPIFYIKHRQKRQCLKCGKIQAEEIEA